MAVETFVADFPHGQRVVGIPSMARRQLFPPEIKKAEFEIREDEKGIYCLIRPIPVVA
jgi:hypothetical protein